MEFKINEDSKFKKLLEQEKNKKRSSIHSFHRYFGKLIPAIPSAAIKFFTKENEWIYDPFAGSGTTLVEAKLHNRNAIGTEINPISCFISKVKTTSIDPVILEKTNSLLLEYINNDDQIVTDAEIPFCINRDHWFKQFVQKDLAKINRNINAFFSKHFIDLEAQKKENITNFYKLVLSSIIRNVSNADPQHVFPGYSKRLRKLDKEGKRKTDVINSFKLSLNKKTKALYDYKNVNEDINIIIENVNSKSLDINKYPRVNLIVTNPPYISSIRYIETMKLELYWMEYIFNQKEYRALETEMIGNDRIYKKEYENILLTNHKYIDEVIEQIYNIDPKSGNIVAKYFIDMDHVIKNMNKMLITNGHVVMKISDSKVKKINVQTGKYLTYLAKLNGFELVDLFIDKIENRSLLTARNTYSDIILHDYIIVWRKVGDLNAI